MRQLTELGESLLEEWERKYGDSGCSCHISPPCGSCTHEGNPRNLAEVDEMWEEVWELEEHVSEVRKRLKVALDDTVKEAHADVAFHYYLQLSEMLRRHYGDY